VCSSERRVCGAFAGFTKEDVEQSIVDRFEQIVRKYPERVAVKAEDCVVTYAELKTKANRLARAIAREPGSRAEPITLLIDKGAPLFAAMLGVFESGKIFRAAGVFYPSAEDRGRLGSFAGAAVGNRPKKYDVSRGIDPSKWPRNRIRIRRTTFSLENLGR
jgi:non-ribosomal peptide synthetase component F